MEEVMVSLRRIEGLNLLYLKKNYALTFSPSIKEYLNNLKNNKLIFIKNDIIKLSETGMLLADQISLELIDHFFCRTK